MNRRTKATIFDELCGDEFYDGFNRVEVYGYCKTDEVYVQKVSQTKERLVYVFF